MYHICCVFVYVLGFMLLNSNSNMFKMLNAENLILDRTKNIFWIFEIINIWEKRKNDPYVMSQLIWKKKKKKHLDVLNYFQLDEISHIK